jgi:hypothetical protein
MKDNPSAGIPFSEEMATSVDHWSLEVFEGLRTWEVARHGSWSRWEPGYLLWKLESFDGEAIEPASIWTSDEELTISCGYWETHLPEWLGPDDDLAQVSRAAQAVQQARRYLGQWLSGELKIAVFTDAAGEWCGSWLVEGDDLLSQLNPEPLANLGPVKVEVQTSRRAGWRRFRIEGDGLVEMI